MRTLELRIPPAALGLLLGATMAAAAHFTPAFGFSLPGSRILAAGLAGAGVVVALLGVVSFRRARTTVNPLQPAAASHLVVSGIYHRTRNPMYLGMLLVLLGWALFLSNLLSVVLAAGFVPLMNRLQILPEERALTALFGSAFADYKSKVRRWL
jgi:protein-S-isoprenylcysteine O-methyltransferase Ste14